ncbi:alpha-amylase family glycosyl hydrolase [Gordonia desulfuricans]|uniref:alpha-amylase family glycosyl hydrolase n=1 Tax=Gordonia desulfuricans TaxID=89051 RepID=UPI00073F2A7D|nr:alpha-amylase family glycosyl hydrolase [Gordonia desulfuricans]
MRAEHVPIAAHPVIYEINTWPWLVGLSSSLGRAVTLGSVPEEVWDEVTATSVTATSGGSGPIDAVWLMGVWQRSPAGVRIGLADGPLVDTFADALPDFTDADVVGSPYSIHDYIVDPHLGGPEGLAAARRALAARGVGLILDFVPNHVATDHPWATASPQRFVTGTVADLAAHPTEFVEVAGTVIANGRDPYFAPWRDVLQLNAFDQGLRAAARDTVRSIADQCDGVRCDMAMLMCNRIFAETWSGRVGPAPDVDYWDAVIPAIRAEHPEFLFIAEAYWGTEGLLRSQGFDHCYDKGFTDALEHHPQSIGSLIADAPDPDGAVHFIENHDEPRAQKVFGDHHPTAAITALTQPGARLLYEGQFDGRTVRLPVQLRREPEQPVVEGLPEFYRRLVAVLGDDALHTGEFTALTVSGWPDHPAGPGLAAWSWTGSARRWLFVVNLDDADGAGLVHTAWNDLAGRPTTLVDPIAEVGFDRPADPEPTIFVMLPPWGAHVLDVDIADPIS